MATKEDLIFARLDRIETKIDHCLESNNLCRVDIAGLKVKSGIWGAIAGMVPVSIGLVLWIMSVQ